MTDNSLGLNLLAMEFAICAVRPVGLGMLLLLMLLFFLEASGLVVVVVIFVGREEGVDDVLDVPGLG